MNLTVLVTLKKAPTKTLSRCRKRHPDLARGSRALTSNQYLFVDDRLEAYNKPEVTGLGEGELEVEEIESADDWA